MATVSAYVTDNLADSPEDENRISKAEKPAKKSIARQVARKCCP